MSFDDPYSVDAFYKTNQEITEMVSPMHTFKIGGEFRITPQISARLGYAYQTSPVKSEYRSGREIPTAGTLTMFTLDRETNYFTVGLGYRFSNVYVDICIATVVANFSRSLRCRLLWIILIIQIRQSRRWPFRLRYLRGRTRIILLF